ncbi:MULTISPECIES: DUF192 domain-containing protein [unclassified Streptomyces]|uniref:DUF192 domain-containing protein n=1 Tax=unclassified Streptomyces TaxID=2593676 RepID=UPI002E2FC179|nr:MULTISPECIES: DUF192 domain-containing protein [unclassified Streptomyces]WUC68652.1 DUF192 domain-containing protein [Streptomyces sp. NBC_00539]
MRRHWTDGEATLRVCAPPGAGESGAAGSLVEVPLEIAASYRARTRGLLGRDGVTGALLLTPAGSVHTFRMRFAIDVAYLDRNLTVIAVTTMPPGRLGLPRPRSRHVLEAAAGAMAEWHLRPGCRVEVVTAERDRLGDATPRG